ncbi:MAG: hypothetical protein C0432_02075 [Candidatus Puniceispirillum sp.]|nr:hypothetical protein [Candidatus Pelagibacter sp.]MBA4283062.1 hypothetical protein [Candidatus Puniceispirillum sp.]
MMDQHFILKDFFDFFLVFCRVLGVFSLVPFLSQKEIPGRIRLFISLGFSFLILPLISVKSSSDLHFILLMKEMIKELIIGSFIGAMSRLIAMILEYVGHFVSDFMGLSSANSFNPNLPESTLLSNVFNVFGVVIFLSLDLHHLILNAFVSTYVLFPMMSSIPFGEYSKSLIQIVAQTFQISLQLVAPLLIVFLISQLTLGFLGRIIPQVQLFFITMPLQLWIGFVVLSMIASSILTYYGDFFKSQIRYFLKI